jgi:hypothetical protein
MRGSPLLRALVALFVVALAGVPVWKLTHPQPAEATQTVAAPSVLEIPIHLTFSTAPRRAEVLHLGKVLWRRDSPGIDVTANIALAFPKEGVDLGVKVGWPPGAPESAVRIRLTDPDHDTHEKTVWGSDELDEVVTFP